MPRVTVTLDTPEGVDPFIHHTGRSKRARIREFIQLLKALVAGLIWNSVERRPSLAVGTARASASVTAAAVQGADTVTLNGQALTATQHHSRGTVTVTVANTDVDDTVTLGLAGSTVDFTAKNAEDTAAGQFDISGTDAAAATSLAACINAAAADVGSDLYGLVTAQAAAAVVTIRAATAGTGGDDVTLASSDADGLQVSGAALSGGAAVGNNEWDFGGTNAQTATAMAEAINNSTTNIVKEHVQASNRAGTITLSGVAAGEWVSVGGVRFTAVGQTPTNVLTEFSIGSTDTNDATALKNAINAHPALKDKVLASSSAGVVTVREVPPMAANAPRVEKSGAGITLGGLTNGALAASAVVLWVAKEKGHAGNAVTCASSNGSRLAITGSASRLSGGTSSTLNF